MQHPHPREEGLTGPTSTPSDAPNGRPTLFGRLTPGGLANFADTLRAEKTGALLLLSATALALLLANSVLSDEYAQVASMVIGPHALHLDLSVAQWAADGLLAVFFFVIGLELKREIVAGQLRHPATAIVPIVAAVGGMAVPALLYLLVNLLDAQGSPHGWGIPVATDIAFAVAVLAAFGRRLPTALRAFLLTLAVVDDLLGIVVIAVFYSDDLHLVWMLASLLAVTLFGWLVRRRVPGVLLVPVAVAAWGFVHASGVHATIAGVLLGMTVPALARTGEHESAAERLEHVWRPISAGVAVPLFALFAAGVRLDASALTGAAGDPAAQGVALALVVGKPLGIVLATWLLVQFTRARLDRSIGWLDVVAVSAVAGIGFTVSLLINELSFAPGSEHTEHVKPAILLASLAAAVIGAVLLTWRNRVHVRRQEAQREDEPVV